MFFHVFVSVTGSCYLIEVGLELLGILLPQHPKCWDHRPAPPHPVLSVSFLSAWQRRGFCRNLVSSESGAGSVVWEWEWVEETPGSPALPSSLFPKRKMGKRRGSPGAEHSRWGWSRSWGVGRSWQAAAPLRPGLGPAGPGLTASPHLQCPASSWHLDEVTFQVVNCILIAKG